MALGLTQAAATKLLAKLSPHAMNAAQANICKQRVERELWADLQRHRDDKAMARAVVVL